jgi:hypothetical protein
MYRRGVLSQVVQIRKAVLTTWRTIPLLPSYLRDDEQCQPYNKQPRRHFKNFGHKPEPMPLFTKLWYSFVFLGFLGLAMDWKGWVQ